MIIFKGKAKDMTHKEIEKAWLKLTRLVEKLESVDFGRN